MPVIRIVFPVSDGSLGKLRAGDRVLVSGTIYVARDAAHRRFMEALRAKKKFPVPLANGLLYYMGPAPAPPGKIIGSCGPTTAGRMDAMTVPLIERGMKATMGKGRRHADVIAACKKYGAVYLITYGGCGAYLAQFVKKMRVAAYVDLGPEAVLQLEVADFPAVVGIDTKGRDFYAGRKKLYNTGLSMESSRP